MQTTLDFIYDELEFSRSQPYKHRIDSEILQASRPIPKAWIATIANSNLDDAQRAYVLSRHRGEPVQKELLDALPLIHFGGDTTMCIGHLVARPGAAASRNRHGSIAFPPERNAEDQAEYQRLEPYDNFMRTIIRTPESFENPKSLRIPDCFLQRREALDILGDSKAVLCFTAGKLNPSHGDLLQSVSGAIFLVDEAMTLRTLEIAKVGYFASAIGLAGDIN
jgi:hypothetical protein